LRFNRKHLLYEFCNFQRLFFAFWWVRQCRFSARGPFSSYRKKVVNWHFKFQAHVDMHTHICMAFHLPNWTFLCWDFTRELVLRMKLCNLCYSFYFIYFSCKTTPILADCKLITIIDTFRSLTFMIFKVLLCYVFQSYISWSHSYGQGFGKSQIWAFWNYAHIASTALHMHILSQYFATCQNRNNKGALLRYSVLKVSNFKYTK
jgi:hypothetical protein